MRLVRGAAALVGTLILVYWDRLRPGNLGGPQRNSEHGQGVVEEREHLDALGGIQLKKFVPPRRDTFDPGLVRELLLAISAYEFIAPDDVREWAYRVRDSERK